MPPDLRPTSAAPDDDPYLWLEVIQGAQALDWVERQNAATLARFVDARFAQDRDGLAAILDRPDNIPYIARRGAWLYNYWKDAAQPRGLWRRTTLADYRNDAPDWEVLLDLDALAASEGEDWIWSGATTLPGSHDRAILQLSRGGGDAVVLREFDLTARSFVEGGFHLPEAKGGAAWIDRDCLLLSSSFGEAMATESGYARSVRRWRRGTPVERADVVFEVGPEQMGVWGGLDRTVDPARVYFVVRPAFFDEEVWLADGDGPARMVDLPRDIEMNFAQGWLAVKRRSAWTLAGKTYPPDTLLGASLAAVLAGEAAYTVLFEPGERRALQDFFWCGGRLVLSILDELAPLYETVTPSPEGWTRGALPDLPPVTVASIWPLDVERSESNGDLLGTLQDPLTPPTLNLLEANSLAGGGAPALLKKAPRAFDPAGLVVSRHEAISVDGERIPYAQVGPPGESGEAPVHMTGYGGFGISLLPTYRAATGKLWLERGGTSVIANIRGGGEFGTRWHDAGRGADKRLSHDDFAAVAQDLVRRGVTRPGRIAAEGGSNGGILITNMLTRYPECFGALFCTIPLIDMRRYSKLLAGASWVDEYGDPDDPADWAHLQTYSAYHQVRPDAAYPPILLATLRKDDRVHPGHARKMAAKLQALGHQAYFYEPAAGGHGYGKDNSETAAFIALGYGFLRQAIGWTDDDGAD